MEGKEHMKASRITIVFMVVKVSVMIRNFADVNRVMRTCTDGVD